MRIYKLTYKKCLLELMFLLMLCLFISGLAFAKTVAPEQPVIPFQDMDAEELIIEISPDEIFTIDPLLIIPDKDQGKEVSLFAMALHSQWALVMGESGWKLYMGEVTMFKEFDLGDTLQQFALDGNRLINTPGDSIDLFYGYAIQEPYFAGNALRFRVESSETIQCDEFQICSTAIAVNKINPGKLPLTPISNRCREIVPSLEVSHIKSDSEVKLFAALLMDEGIMLKTDQGWEEYYDGDLIPFMSINSGNPSISDDISMESPSLMTLTGFDFPLTLLPENYEGEVFLYYAVNVEGKTELLGNALRFHILQDEQTEKEVFAFAQNTKSIDTIASWDLPLTKISDACDVISPSLYVADEDAGNKGELFAIIIVDNEIIVKSSEGWKQYDGAALFPFASTTLGTQVSGFDLPLAMQDSSGSSGEIGFPVIPHDSEVVFYYGCLVNRETLKGNAMRVKISLN
ncbi:exported hypothetical protein [Desulfamplus magnetovallimortis]|uniref:Uncharacterized protein n=1 Tax=Desulfamplus magnetovallimortis TaxID=1246637 RepID=A0A1W1HAG8_9BACT|nr:hypothetical protein [Desulfamplus magnetovallimortis]SLM29494.1 exported hypothetical protein [Desulfamplus magnetovallimortis]